MLCKLEFNKYFFILYIYFSGDILKKIFFIFAGIITLLSFIFLDIDAASNNVIVIDPGHGGRDLGATSNNVIEAELNLEISKILGQIFTKNNYKVIYTRNDNNDLSNGKFNKKEDMRKRVQIVNNSNALLLISIHMNTYTDSKYKGAQVFYSNSNKLNEELALNIQNKLTLYTDTTRKIVNRTNIYILNSVIIPSALVECGFITNEEEKNKLLTSEYQYILCDAIYQGVIEFIKNYL